MMGGRDWSIGFRHRFIGAIKLKAGDDREPMTAVESRMTNRPVI